MLLSIFSLAERYKHGFESVIKSKSNKGFMDGIFGDIFEHLNRMIGKHWLIEEAALKALATFALDLLGIVTPSTRLLVRYSSPPFNTHEYFSSIKSLVDNFVCVILVLVNSNGTYHFLKWVLKKLEIC